MSAKRKRPQPAKPPTIAELSKALGVNVRTLKGWLAEGCPRESIDDVRAWHAEHKLPRKGGPRKSDEQHDSLQRRRILADARKAEADARAAELRNAEKRKRLIAVKQVVREAAEIFAEVRAILDSIPDAVSKEFPAKLRARAYDVERNKIDLALRKLAAIQLVGRDRSPADGA